MKNQNEDKSVKKSSFRKNKAGKKVIGPNDVLSTEMLREYAQAMHKAQKEGKRALSGPFYRGAHPIQKGSTLMP